MSKIIRCEICKKEVNFEKPIECVKVRSNVRLFQGEKFTVWRCPFCNSIHSKQDVDLEKIYENYPLFDLENSLFVNFTLFKRIKRLKKVGLKKDDRILDYGCGSGNMVSYLRFLGYKNSEGYDKYNIKFSNKNILDYKYDFIMCQDVLEHSQTPNLILNNLVKLLKKKGILSVGTTNADYIQLNDPEKFLMPLHQPYHRHIFSEKTLILIANKMGLKLKKFYNHYYVNSILPFINHRFMIEYHLKKENILDPASYKKLDTKTVINPKIMFYTIFGYFFPPKTEMEIIFQLSN